jgi:succinate dehydrogenase flavin-adding protein (antitoxin of CptAB toxin-antitoxin module)
MTYSFNKIREYINIQSLDDFNSILKGISPSFFSKKFEKSKNECLDDIKRLLEQIDHDFHFVWILKQEKYAFQLQWKESVLKAHVEVLMEQIPISYWVKKVV